MADAYLNVAERALIAMRRPLRPKDILQWAYAEQLLPWHLHGSTQDKTLHARISEDLSRNPEASRFFRTGPGIFFLKELVEDPAIPDAFKQPYYAPPRRKELRRDRILAFDRLGDAQSFGEFIGVDVISNELEQGLYKYCSYADLLNMPASAAAHSFVMVFHEDKVLSYRCGKFSPTSDPLYGMRSIGIGGAVYAGDRDLLFRDMFGIVASGIKELGYGIGLPKHLSERARYNNEIVPYSGVPLKGHDRAPSIVHVILAYECPPEFVPSKAALSVNELRWIDLENPSNSLDDFDETSRLLFQARRVADVRAKVQASVE